MARWENLFDDLEGQLEQELGAEELDLRAEEERLRLGRLALRDRLAAASAAAPESVMRFALAGGDAALLRPRTFGRDWCSGDLVEEPPRRGQFVLPLSAVVSVGLDRAQLRGSLEPSPRDDERGLASRLGLAFVLRDLCRRRSALEVQHHRGRMHGTIDRVGRDHFDLAVHEPGIPRRESAVVEHRVVPFAALVMIRL